MALSKENKNRKKEIKQFIKLRLSDQRIASLINISIKNVQKYRKLFKIKSPLGKGRPWSKEEKKRFKKIICSIINKETSDYPFSDCSIQKILARFRIKASKWKVLRYRHVLGIPPSASHSKGELNRRYLYLTEGRFIWKPDGKHIKRVRRKK